MAAQKHITAIVPSAKKPGRASIRVGGKSVATLSLTLIGELGLAVGQPWDQDMADRVDDAGAFDKAMAAATRRLARRAMSQKQVSDKLHQLGYSQAVRTQVLDRLIERNLLDDRVYGQALIRQLTMRKAAGPRLLQQKLFQKGLSQAIIEELLSETIDEDDQVEQAIALARKKLVSMNKLAPAARKRRLYGQLARRGFNGKTISQTMNAVADMVRGDSEN